MELEQDSHDRRETKGRKTKQINPEAKNHTKIPLGMDLPELAHPVYTGCTSAASTSASLLSPQLWYPTGMKNKRKRPRVRLASLARAPKIATRYRHYFCKRESNYVALDKSLQLLHVSLCHGIPPCTRGPSRTGPQLCMLGCCSSNTEHYLAAPLTSLQEGRSASDI